MSNESNSDNDINSNSNNLEYNSEILPLEGENTPLETEQKKPKRKYSKRKQSSEPNRVGHIIPIQKSTGGSTIQQSRKKRERNNRHKQELTAESGFIPNGLPDAKPESRPSKPGKDKVRRIHDMESEEDDIEDIEDNELDSLLSGMIPFFAQRMNPIDNILNRLTSAFVGCPVVTHLAKTSPDSQRLIIEIDI